MCTFRWRTHLRQVYVYIMHLVMKLFGATKQVVPLSTNTQGCHLSRSWTFSYNFDILAEMGEYRIPLALFVF